MEVLSLELLFTTIDHIVAPAPVPRNCDIPKPITPKGYDSFPGRIITHFIVATMCIDGYTLTGILFLILDLGDQNIILGDAWMAHFDVHPDLRH